ncbi:STAS domain-containing protein [Acrocarpospora phusangensis]|uniref:STAS domain-containing protein n=1 Tax=Acrocarpospora phusangensis TaxID=1070424 RepID=UPI001EF25234|nr:STAS domain-containing protein [Acrocarpospora phusangensis]
MEILITRAERVVRLTLIGDLDFLGAPALRRTIRDAGVFGRPVSRFERSHLYLDLARIAFIDCAGARTLVWAAARMRGRLTVLYPSRPVVRLLTLLEFDRFLTVVERGDTLNGDVPNPAHASPEPFRRRDGSSSDDPAAPDPGAAADREADPPRLAGPA